MGRWRIWCGAFDNWYIWWIPSDTFFSFGYVLCSLYVSCIKQNLPTVYSFKSLYIFSFMHHKHSHLCICVEYVYVILIKTPPSTFKKKKKKPPLPQVGCNTRSIFNRCTAGLNGWIHAFLKSIDCFFSFLRAIMWSKMQTVLSRIWTQVAQPIFYSKSCYIMCFFYLRPLFYCHHLLLKGLISHKMF